MSANDLPTEIVKIIAEGSGRCYSYEGKRMAQEIMRRRAAEQAAAAAAAQANTTANAPLPPWGLLPP